jgi:Pentapeptide repeats (8 copies)
LREASLFGAQLQGAFFHLAHLDGVDLRQATLADETYGAPRLADVRWGEVNLAVVDWTTVKILGDEHRARKTKDIDDYQKAVRANRQLAVVLQAQGLNEVAARFAYCAQKLQSIVLRRQKKFGQYLFSGFLDLLAGYGYRPGRSVIWYLVTIIGFALAYFAIGHLPFFPDAFVFSLTSFHGRGFFPGLGSENSLHNPLGMVQSKLKRM